MEAAYIAGLDHHTQNTCSMEAAYIAGLDHYTQYTLLDGGGIYQITKTKKKSITEYIQK